MSKKKNRKKFVVRKVPGVPQEVVVDRQSLQDLEEMKNPEVKFPSVLKWKLANSCWEDDYAYVRMLQGVNCKHLRSHLDGDNGWGPFHHCQLICKEVKCLEFHDARVHDNCHCSRFEPLVPIPASLNPYIETPVPPPGPDDYRPY